MHEEASQSLVKIKVLHWEVHVRMGARAGPSSQQSMYLLTFKGAQESIPSLAGRYDNPI